MTGAPLASSAPDEKKRDIIIIGDFHCAHDHAHRELNTDALSHDSSSSTEQRRDERELKGERKRNYIRLAPP